jgi:hypothetical protein
LNDLSPLMLELSQTTVTNLRYRLLLRATNLAIDLLNPSLGKLSATWKPISSVSGYFGLQFLPTLIVAFSWNPPSPLKLPQRTTAMRTAQAAL